MNFRAVFFAFGRRFYLACFVMYKKGLILPVYLLVCLLTGSYAQVPLHIEPDSSVAFPDTLLKKNASRSVHHAAAGKSQSKIDSLVSYAFSFYGNRYKRGGTGGAGFDCSGFTMVVFRQMGVRLPHTSAGQGLIGINVSRPNIQKGDLIFFRGANRRSRRIGHVGIVISEKGEPVRFIHSSTSSGVRVDALDFAYYRNRYVKTVRIPDLYQ